MGANKKSSRMRWLLQQVEHSLSNTSPTQTTQIYQNVATEVLLTLGANHSTNQNNHSQHAAENCTTCCLCHTSQADGSCWKDQWNRSDRWTLPVRLVATTDAQQSSESLSDFFRPWNKYHLQNSNLRGKSLHKTKKTTLKCAKNNP
jgi:hypothetical protein